MSPELKLDGTIIASFEEGAVHCLTPEGPLGLSWRIDPTEGIRQILLDCTEAPTLAGDLVARAIQLNRRGNGQTTLDGARCLEFNMGRRIAEPHRVPTNWRIRKHLSFVR